MAARRWVHVEMVVDHSVTYDLMQIAEGKALAGTFHMRPVKHGGEQENGELKATPTAREFMMLWMTEHPRFKVREAVEEAGHLGVSKGSVAGMCHALMKEGYLKRVDKGEYATTVNASKRRSAKAATKSSNLSKALRGKAKPKAGERMQDKIIALLQRAPEDGMDVADLKKILQTNGANSVSPTLTQMLRDKLIKRPKPGIYVIAARGAAAADAAAQQQ